MILLPLLHPPHIPLLLSLLVQLLLPPAVPVLATEGPESPTAAPSSIHLTSSICCSFFSCCSNFGSFIFLPMLLLVFLPLLLPLLLLLSLFKISYCSSYSSTCFSPCALSCSTSCSSQPSSFFCCCSFSFCSPCSVPSRLLSLSYCFL